MKSLLRKLFFPLLARLESGERDFSYQPSHRIILLFMSVVFFGLGAGVFSVSPKEDFSYLIPVILFSGGGFLGLVIAFLANDRAIAKIWGNS